MVEETTSLVLSLSKHAGTTSFDKLRMSGGGHG
jgi:hypothetical protein